GNGPASALDTGPCSVGSRSLTRRLSRRKLGYRLARRRATKQSPPSTASTPNTLIGHPPPATGFVPIAVALFGRLGMGVGAGGEGAAKPVTMIWNVPLSV